ncbi:unnamed protein product [Enterobius vermicularis]|uniref:CSTF2_hinge domain-containing protein n=1 Tax=Enterobius vermicularis TaxID=51028 RepID=A0A0N4VBT9_ENTVE|nr:unnamed protein product [Enterobius vermicularis]
MCLLPDGRPGSPQAGLPQAQVNPALVQLQDPATQVLYTQLMTNQFFQNVLAQASLLQPAVAVAQQQQPQIALANPTPSLATQAVQGTVPAQLLLQPSQQLLQFLMMNQQLAAQALQQPQINPFNQTQAVQLRGLSCYTRSTSRTGMIRKLLL